MAWIVSQGRAWALVLGISSLLSFLGYLYKFGFDANLFNRRIAYLPETGQLIIGRYQGIYGDMQWNTIFSNMWYALVSSSSYLMTSLLVIIVLIVAVLRRHIFRQFKPALSLFVGFGLLIHAILAQGVNTYFLTYSSPDLDTGLTRFSQAWFFVSILLFVNLYPLRPGGCQDTCRLFHAQAA
jgi:hypothetical protein